MASLIFKLCLLATLASVSSLTSAVIKNPKRGLAFAESTFKSDISKVNTTKSVISWQYDWDQSVPEYLAKSHIPYVPMQWGRNNITNFTSLVKKQGAQIALGFNEPDLPSQSNLTVLEAVTYWKQYINPLRASGVRLGAPAISGNGRSWLADFLAQCTGCSIDFLPIHWYGEGIGNFYDYIWQVHGQFPNYPIWITEYASTSSSNAEVLDFIKSTAAYLDTLDWVERYAWFAFFQRKEPGNSYNLVDSEGNLSALGEVYING